MRAQTMNGLIAVVSTSLVLASCGFRSGLEAGSMSQTNYGAAEKPSFEQSASAAIADFQIEVVDSTAFAAWSTKLPTSSQVKLVNTITGETILTESNGTLSTEHRVSVSGLQSGVAYAAQAVSVSEDLGPLLSEIIEVTLAD